MDKWIIGDEPKINNPDKQYNVVCEWSYTHTHIHPKIYKNITKIITGRNTNLGMMLTQEKKTRHELN